MCVCETMWEESKHVSWLLLAVIREQKQENEKSLKRWIHIQQEHKHEHKWVIMFLDSNLLII